MKQVHQIALALALLASVAATSLAAEARRFGQGVQLKESLSISQLVGAPDAYAGKVVRVEGRVMDVCPKKGCWMELGADAQSVRIKVEDDVIVFPREAKGKQAVAEGKVQIIELSRAQYQGWLEHLAEERGEAFDPATVGPGPYRVIEIQAVGAEIEAL